MSTLIVEWLFTWNNYVWSCRVNHSPTSKLELRCEISLTFYSFETTLLLWGLSHNFWVGSLLGTRVIQTKLTEIQRRPEYKEPWSSNIHSVFHPLTYRGIVVRCCILEMFWYGPWFLIIGFFLYSNRWNIKNGPTDCGEPPGHMVGPGIILDLLKIQVIQSSSESS